MSDEEKIDSDPANEDALARQVIFERLPSDVAQAMATALISGRWLFAVFEVRPSKSGRGNDLHLFRSMNDFPDDDRALSLDMLEADFRKLESPGQGRRVRRTAAPPADVLSLFKSRRDVLDGVPNGE